jgi:hypothetical protein
MKIITDTFEIDALRTTIAGFSAPVKVATVDNIDATAIATTPLFTVPTGKTFIYEMAFVRITNFTLGSKTTDAGSSLGTNSPLYDNLPQNLAVGSTAVDQVWRMALMDGSMNGFPVCTAGDVVTLNIAIASDATVEKWSIDLFGYYVEDLTVLATPETIPIRTITVPFSSSDLLNMPTTPKLLIPAPPAGKFIKPVSYQRKYTFGTTAYTLSGGFFYFNYNPTGPQIGTSSTVEASNFIDQSTDLFASDVFLHVPSYPLLSDVDGIPLYLTTDLTSVTLGDGTMSVTIQYMILDM